MAFDLSEIDLLLPDYLSKTDKDRLKKGLEQFKVINDKEKFEWSPKLYTNFFLEKNQPYFLQGDLVAQIRNADWDYEKKRYGAVYSDAIIVSATCDIEAETKNRNIPKQILFAPIVPYEEYLNDLEQSTELAKKIQTIKRGIKAQEYSNLFYIPQNPNNKTEYIALLDQIFWFPTDELNSYSKNIEQNRIISLDYFGFFLFILKLSYHLCRLPEDQHRT